MTPHPEPSAQHVNAFHSVAELLRRHADDIDAGMFPAWVCGHLQRAAALAAAWKDKWSRLQRHDTSRSFLCSQCICDNRLETFASLLELNAHVRVAHTVDLLGVPLVTDGVIRLREVR